MGTAHTEDKAPASRVLLEKEGSGPAAARVETATRTRKRRMVVLDGALRM